MTMLEKLRDKREVIFALADKYGAKNLRVFGSVARGEENEDSDIDFLVENIEFIKGLERVELQMELEDLLKKNIDIVIAQNLTGYRKERILQESINI